MQAAIILVLEVPLGIWADKVNRRIPIILAIVFGGLWLILTGITTLVSLLYVAEACNAISLSLVSGVMTAEYLDRHLQQARMGSEDDRNEVQKPLVKYNRVSFTFMALAAGVGGIAYSLSPSGLWIFTGSACLFIALYYAIRSAKFPPIDHQKENTPDNDQTIQSFFSGIRLTLQAHRGIAPLVLLGSILYSSFQVAIQYWQLTLEEPLQQSDKATLFINLTLTIVFVVLLFVQSRAEKLVEFLMSRKSLLLFSIIVPAGLWLASSLTYIWFIQILCIVFYFYLYRGSDIVVNTEMNKGMSSDIRSTVMAVRASLARIVSIAIAPLVSFAVMQQEASGAVVVVLGLSLLAGIIATFVLSIKKDAKQTLK